MFFICQDRIIWFEIVLFKKILPICDLNVEEGISHAEEGK